MNASSVRTLPPVSCLKNDVQTSTILIVALLFLPAGYDDGIVSLAVPPSPHGVL